MPMAWLRPDPAERAVNGSPRGMAAKPTARQAKPVHTPQPKAATAAAASTERMNGLSKPPDRPTAAPTSTASVKARATSRRWLPRRRIGRMVRQVVRNSTTTSVLTTSRSPVAARLAANTMPNIAAPQRMATITGETVAWTAGGNRRARVESSMPP